MGIEPEHLPISLNVFIQDGPIPQKAADWGLYICPYHSGRRLGKWSIHAESVKRTGSVFTVRIPPGRGQSLPYRSFPTRSFL